MARIFISHSSRDNDAADRMKVWLAGRGFENAFLDKDKTTGIPPGADWERKLYREVEQSQAVIILQTPDWLASKWCFAEFTQARALGKAIFPVIETSADGARIAPDIQALNLTSDRADGLERLARELVRIALDAQGGFAWDSARPPFPGLLAFQEEDAAVYFGRDDDIRRLIERLEARRAQGGPKLIALLGSSGSGKSSLLRAGVIPRLKRAGRNWIVVPPIRPRLHPVDELAHALATACNPPLDWAKLRDDLLGPDPVRTLNDFAGDLRVKAGSAEAQILMPIDQGEELFGVGNSDEVWRFLAILSRALSADMPFLAVMALRSDYLGQLQSATAPSARFEELQFNEFSLGPMPMVRIPQIIKGPAKVAALGVEDAFVQQAADDAGTEDALPMLAFALRELSDRSPNKVLTLAGYEALGDDKARPLENAVRQAADRVLADAKPGDIELTALREAFVPAMVRVNDKGEYARRPAQMDGLPAQSHRLLELLANARLLVLRQDSDARVIEVAHEALLRKWPLLRSWLDTAKDFLIGKQQLEQDLRDWEQLAPETTKARALLTGLKLDRARRWLVEYPRQLTPQERGFVQASIKRAENEEERAREEERSKAKTRRFITWGSVAAAILLAVIAGWAVWEWRQSAAHLRDAQYKDSLLLASKSEEETSRGNAVNGMLLALQGLPKHFDVHSWRIWENSVAADRPIVPETVGALINAMAEQRELPSWGSVSVPVNDQALAVIDKPHLVIISDKRGMRIVDSASGTPAGRLDAQGPNSLVYGLAVDMKIGLVVTTNAYMGLDFWSIEKKLHLEHLEVPSKYPLRLASNIVQEVLAAGSEDYSIYLVDLPLMKKVNRIEAEGEVSATAFSRDGVRLAASIKNGKISIWTSTNWRSEDTTRDRDPIGTVLGYESPAKKIAFSSSGFYVTAAYEEGVKLWNVTEIDSTTGKIKFQVLEQVGLTGPASTVAFAPSRDVLAAGYADGSVRILDIRRGRAIETMTASSTAIVDLAFITDDKLVTLDSAGMLRAWDATSRYQLGKLSADHFPSDCVAFARDRPGLVVVSEPVGPWIPSSLTSLWVLEPDGQVRFLHEKMSEKMSGGSVCEKLATSDEFLTTSSKENTGIVIAGPQQRPSVAKRPSVELALDGVSPHAQPIATRDGQTIVAAMAAGGVGIWSASGEALANWKTTHPVVQMELSADDRTVLARLANGDVRFWPMPMSLPEIIDQARKRLPRCLSDDEAVHFGLVASRSKTSRAPVSEVETPWRHCGGECCAATYFSR